MIGPLIFLVMGLIPFTIGLVFFFKGKRTEKWKPIVGRVKEVKLGAHFSSGSGGGGEHGGGGGGWSYQCLVNYEYDSPKGNGVLEGNKIAVGYLPTSNEKGHKKIKAKLESANKVQLWINPNDESQTIICKGYNRLVYFYWTLGLMIMLFAIGMMTTPEKKRSHHHIFHEYNVEVIDYKSDK